MSRPGRAGLASLPLAAQRDRVLASWDGFLAAAEDADLDRPSRLPGWSGHDVLVHVGDWPGVPTLDTLLAEARSGDGGARRTTRTRATRRWSPRTGTRRGRTCWQRCGGPATGSRPGSTRRTRPTGPGAGWRAVMSAVGPLPLLTVVNAGGYELAVHALDLGVRPDERLLDAGLAALVDVTGVFATGAGCGRRSPRGRAGQAGRSGPTGTAGSPPRSGNGRRVRRSRAMRRSCSTRRPDGARCQRCCASRTMRVHGLADIVRLAPIVDEVPGLTRRAGPQGGGPLGGRRRPPPAPARRLSRTRAAGRCEPGRDGDATAAPASAPAVRPPGARPAAGRERRPAAEAVQRLAAGRLSAWGGSTSG